MHNLVLIHGRSQEHHDADSLKAAWIDALRSGLDAAKLRLDLDEKRIRFPYYGDRLVALIGSHPENAPEIIIKGPSGATDAQSQFTEDVIREVAEGSGITDIQIRQFDPGDVQEKGFLNWRWTLATMRAISSLGGSGASISLFTQDVYRYLFSTGVRDGIESGVMDSIRAKEPTVVVSHSLGTIINYNLLRREAARREWNILTHITLGSPLAIPTIKRSLAPVSFPKGVGQWLNARDKKDMVALYPLTPPAFPVQPITNNNDIQNDTSNHHGITG